MSAHAGVEHLNRVNELARSLPPAAVDLMLDCHRRGVTGQVALNYQGGTVRNADYRERHDFERPAQKDLTTGAPVK